MKAMQDERETNNDDYGAEELHHDGSSHEDRSAGCDSMGCRKAMRSADTERDHTTGVVWGRDVERLYHSHG